MAVDQENRPSIDNDSRWISLYEKKMEQEAVECFRYFRSMGFEPVLIKGWAAARNYPPGTPRFYSDLDLAFAAEDYERARRLPVTDPNFRFAVDFHCELKHLDARPWDEIFSNSVTVNLDGCDIRIPAAEDHLRILATHWLNDGGTQKERLWDIFYAVENRPDDFDWNACVDTVSPNRRAWVVIAIGVVHRYLHLNIDDLPFASEAKDLPNWLTAELEREWRSGVRLRPLSFTLRNPREFLRQVRKRLPPNPIEATIELDGDLRGRRRFLYQLGSISKRIGPSARTLKYRIFDQHR